MWETYLVSSGTASPPDHPCAYGDTRRSPDLLTGFVNFNRTVSKRTTDSSTSGTRSKKQQKTDFDYISYGSDVECQCAELLDSHEDIKLFMKLPPEFLIPTPVGDYNPDWAILRQEDGQQKIYMIRETKSIPISELLRPTEVAKIDCGKKHFAAIGIDDYAKASPEDWKI